MMAINKTVPAASNRDFKGIWIPKEIWLNKDLSLMEKVFLVEINSLDNDNGCFASNEYFSKFFGISKPRCTQIIKSLETKGVLKIGYSYKAGSKEIEKRTLKIGSKFSYDGIKNIKQGVKNIKGTCLENAKDNNTLSNNTFNNTINIEEGKPFSDLNDFSESSFFNACKDVWFEFNPDWQFEAKDGSGLKALIKKIHKAQEDAGKEITPDATVAAFEFILKSISTDNFYSTANPSTLNSHFNTIIKKLKSKSNGQFFTTGDSRQQSYATNPYRS